MRQDRIIIVGSVAIAAAGDRLLVTPHAQLSVDIQIDAVIL